jgi:hypothetical protein
MMGAIPSHQECPWLNSWTRWFDDKPSSGDILEVTDFV